MDEPRPECEVEGKISSAWCGTHHRRFKECQACSTIFSRSESHRLKAIKTCPIHGEQVTPPAEATPCSEDCSQGERDLRRVGTALAEAALYTIREYDGIHRLALAVADWSKAVADEGGRRARYAATPHASNCAGDCNEGYGNNCASEPVPAVPCQPVAPSAKAAPRICSDCGHYEYALGEGTKCDTCDKPASQPAHDAPLPLTAEERMETWARLAMRTMSPARTDYVVYDALAAFYGTTREIEAAKARAK